MKVRTLIFPLCVALATSAPTRDEKTILERGLSSRKRYTPASIADGSPDVSIDTLSNMKLFSQYSAAAYCNTTYAAVGVPIVCATGNCPMVEAANATTMSIFMYLP